MTDSIHFLSRISIDRLFVQKRLLLDSALSRFRDVRFNLGLDLYVTHSRSGQSNEASSIIMQWLLLSMSIITGLIFNEDSQYGH